MLQSDFLQQARRFAVFVWMRITPTRACACMRGAVLCLMVALAGCTLHARRQASLPPPPNPDVVKPAAEPPLSIPQTSASLNYPREWNAAAIPPEQPPQDPPVPEKVEVAPAAHSPQHKAATPPAKPPETSEAPAAVVPPEPEQPAAPAPAASETAPFQPIIPADQQKQLQNAITARKRDVLSLLAKAGEHGGNDKTLVDNIKSFLNLAEDAEKRGDFTQADNLSERALVLAQELKVE